MKERYQKDINLRFWEMAPMNP